MKEFGKDLNHNTFLYWRKTGAAILDPKFEGVNYRASTKKNDITDKFEQMVMEIVENSKQDIGSCFEEKTTRRRNVENPASNNVILLKKEKINLQLSMLRF